MRGRERERGQSCKIKLAYIKSKGKRYSTLITSCGVCIQWAITQPLKKKKILLRVTTRVNSYAMMPAAEGEHLLGSCTSKEASQVIKPTGTVKQRC